MRFRKWRNALLILINKNLIIHHVTREHHLKHKTLLILIIQIYSKHMSLVKFMRIITKVHYILILTTIIILFVEEIQLNIMKTYLIRILLLI